MADTLFPSDVGTFLKDYGDTVSILVIGEGGSGRSTLVSNLLGEEPPEEISAPSSAQVHANIITRQSKEFPLIVYEAIGEVQYNETDEEYFKVVKSLLQDEKPTVVVLCLKLSETRMRNSLAKFIKEHHKAGLNWRKVVIALTFADSIPVPKSERQHPNRDKGAFFNNHVKVWTNKIRSMLVTEVGVLDEAVKHIPMAPTSSLQEDELDNQMLWYEAFWQCLIDVVKAHQFTTIANETQTPVAAGQPLVSAAADTKLHNNTSRAEHVTDGIGVNGVEDLEDMQIAAEPTVQLIDNQASFSPRSSAMGHESGEQHLSGEHHGAPPSTADAKTVNCCKCSSCCKFCNIL